MPIFIPFLFKNTFIISIKHRHYFLRNHFLIVVNHQSLITVDDKIVRYSHGIITATNRSKTWIEIKMAAPMNSLIDSLPNAEDKVEVLSDLKALLGNLPIQSITSVVANVSFNSVFDCLSTDNRFVSLKLLCHFTPPTRYLYLKLIWIYQNRHTFFRMEVFQTSGIYQVEKRLLLIYNFNKLSWEDDFVINARRLFKLVVILGSYLCACLIVTFGIFL